MTESTRELAAQIVRDYGRAPENTALWNYHISDVEKLLQSVESSTAQACYLKAAQLCEQKREAARILEDCRGLSPSEQAVNAGKAAQLREWADELDRALAGGREAPDAKVRCLDCGLDYALQPLDVTLTKEQWKLINPEMGGVLCPNCIVNRAGKLPHVITVAARIMFADDYDKFVGALDVSKVIAPQEVFGREAMERHDDDK